MIYRNYGIKSRPEHEEEAEGSTEGSEGERPKKDEEEKPGSVVTR